MSRGTRIGGDVYCVGSGPEEEEDDRDYLPDKFSFPEGFCTGSGRILSLNNRLLKWYGDIGFYHNEELADRIASGRNTILQGMQGWLVNSEINLARVNVNEKSRQICCTTAIEMLVELQALGSQIFVPEELVDAGYVQRPPQIAPFGSMSYLCSSPHYFSPEEYDVPHGLPALDKAVYSMSSRNTLEGSNRYLAFKYGVLARSLNRIKLYRDNRIRSKLDVSHVIPGNNLEEYIMSCRSVLDNIIDELWKYIDLGRGDELFYMPSLLRDKIFEENAIVNVRELKNISCLYREGGRPDRTRRYTYLLYESVMGYSLFRVYGAADDAERLPPLLDVDCVKSYVKLVDHYPFTTDSAQLEHCKYISKAIVSDELRLFLQLNLPPWKMWNWSYTLGVSDQKLAEEIQKETQIPCVSGPHVVDLFRGVHQHFHAFLEIESSKVDMELLRTGRLYRSEPIRIENMVIQAVHSLDINERNIRLLSLNLRKLYSPYFPELDGIVKDNYSYAKIVKCIGNKSQLSQRDSTALNVIAHPDLVKLITDSAKSSIGQDITPSDLDIVNLSANNIIRLVKSCDKLLVNLAEYMKAIAPNLRALIGDLDGARLITCAGGRSNLVKMCDTLQLLGADNSSSSDGGILWNSDLVARATTTESKRKLASYLGSCCYSASCEDYFQDASSSAGGKKLYAEMQGKLHLTEKKMEEKRKLFEQWNNFINYGRERRTGASSSEEDSSDSSSGSDSPSV